MESITSDIIRQAAGGDMAAFERIYRASSGFVFNVAYRVTGSAPDAQEITQDVFIKVHRHLNEFEFRSSLKTWLYRITVNTALNARKKLSKEMNRRVDFDTIVETHGARETPAAPALEQEDTERVVNGMLDKLNPGQRACIVLREMQGLRYEEIAQALKVNVNTVRSRLKRAREQLLSLRPAGGVRV